MIFILTFLTLINAPGVDLLSKTADRYAKAGGIQWSMESVTHSTVFDETQTTFVQFAFNAPDTFYYKSDQEEVIGIADTVWVMSKKHQQIQKRLAESYTSPIDLIIKWNSRYSLDSFKQEKDGAHFKLTSHEGITPAQVEIISDKNNRLKKLSYKDAAENDVSLSIKKERIGRSQGINFFYKNIPKDYKLIDLTE
jgi:hypothetical protein